MRRPRLTQFYRAYPELDAYSDEECVRLVWQARVRRGDALWVLPGAAALMAFLAWMFVGATIFLIVFTVLSPQNTRPTPGGFLVPTVLVGVMVFAIVWTLMRRGMIVRSIRNILNRAGCPFCDFSLVGLPVRDNRVVCPECGSTVRLFEHKITAEDLVGDTPGAIAQQRDRLGAGPMGAHGRGEHRAETQRRKEKNRN